MIQFNALLSTDVWYL